MTTRIAAYILAGSVGMAAFLALPAAAEDGPAKPVAAGSEKLSQALVQLSTANSFEIRGLDRVGDETVQPPKSGSTVKALRRLLTGYAYTVELAPADPAGKAPAKLVRVSILGHSSDVAAGDTFASPGSAPAGSAVGDTGASAPDGATPTHPVTKMMQTLAQSVLPVVPPATGGTGRAAGGSSPSTNGSPSSAPAMDPVNNPADMAALTHTASANLGALVQSLKAACPAGSTC